jgi:hypothetical protein
MKTGRRRLAQAVLAMAVTIGILVVGTPAFAQSSTCTIWAPTGRSCTTGSVPPSTNAHHIHWLVDTVYCGAHWQVIDTRNGAQVGVGDVPKDAVGEGFIYGLYSSAGYHLRITNSCYATFGRISNT